MPELVETFEKQYAFGEFTYKARGDILTLSGYVSTKEEDLGGDDCPPESWRKYLPMFEANPIYCYNHWLITSSKKYADHMGALPPHPIGLVKKVSIDSTGLFLDNIEITPGLEITDKMVIPLVQHGVLKQQSAGFWNMERTPKSRGGNTLTENWLQEASIVPLAQNPFGTDVELKCIDGWEKFSDVKQIIKAIGEGRLNLRPSVHHVAIDLKNSGNENRSQDANREMDNLKPVFVQVSALAHNEKAYDPTGEATAKPPRYSKFYTEVAELIYAAKSVEGPEDNQSTTFLFQIAEPTEKGFVYNFDLLALSTAKVLGAKGGAKISGEEKAEVVKRLSEAYAVLGKDFPVYEKSGEDISAMPAWKLKDVHYSEIKFLNGEDAMVRKALAKTDAKNLLAALKGDEDIVKSDEVQEVAKYIGGSVSVSLYSGLYDPDAVIALTEIVASIARANKAEFSAYSEYGSDAPLTMKWAEGQDTIFAVGKPGEESTVFKKEDAGFVATEEKKVAPTDAQIIKSFTFYNTLSAMSQETKSRLIEVESEFAKLPQPKAKSSHWLMEALSEDF